MFFLDLMSVKEEGRTGAIVHHHMSFLFVYILTSPAYISLLLVYVRVSICDVAFIVCHVLF